MTAPSRRRLTLWIVCLAILWAALAPALASIGSLSAGKPMPWHEICTTSGLPSSALSSASGDGLPSPDKARPATHCPWCVLQAWIGLPPATVSGIHPALASFVSPRHADDPPLRGATRYRPAAPRGPPLIS